MDEFVAKLHVAIAAVSEHPHVEVELTDGSRVAVESITAEPGVGFVTLHPHPVGERPDAVVVPLGAIRRIEISASEDPARAFGFTLPPAG